MKDEAKTKVQLIDERVEPRQQTTGLEVVHTEREQAEEALQESEDRYRSLVDLSPDIIYRLDEDGKIVFISLAVQQLGYDPEELVDKPFEKIVHPDDREKATNGFVERRVGDRAMKDVEIRLLAKAGEARDYAATHVMVSVSARGLWDVPDDQIKRPDKSFLCTQGIARDITERKLAEEELRKHRDHLEELVAERTAELQRANEQLLLEIAERKRAEEEIQRNYEAQDVLNSLLRLSLEDISLEGVLNRALGLILSISWLAFESRGSIFLVEDEPDILVMKAQKGLKEALLKECARIPFGKCHCGRAALTQEIQFADHLGDRHETTYEGIAPHGDYCVPILSSDRNLGVINLCLREGHHRSEREEEFLTAIANTLAGIILRKQAEEAVARLASFPTENPNPVLETDPEGNVLYVNPSGERLLEHLGLDLFADFLPLEHREIVRTCLETGQSGSPIEVDVGDYVFSWRYHPVDAGNRVHLYGTDITERKRAEEEIARSLSLLQVTLESTADGILVVDQRGRIAGFNQRFVDMWSIPDSILASRDDDQALGFVLDQLKDPESFLAKVRELYNQPDAEDYDVLDLRDGRVFEHYSQAQRIGEESVARVWSFRDITERVQAEEALWTAHDELERRVEERTAELLKANEELQYQIEERKQAEKQLRLQGAALESAANAIVITDREGRIAWVNPAFTQLTGYASEEALGQNPRILKSGKHDRTLYWDLWKTVLAGQVWRGEMINRRKDGSFYTEEMTITPVRDMDEEITHFIAVKEDITERKQAEEELHVAKQVAEAASQAKSDFLASMSHELRTPLNAIIGFSEVLQEQYFGELNDKQVQYVGDILESGKHLLSLINDILDLSKIEAGKEELRLSQVNIGDLLEHSLVMIREKAMKHGIGLDLHISRDVVGLEITADERKLRQTMFNLLSNAAKFTPDGGAITVEAGREGEGLIITVADTGIGVAPEHQEKIFEEFYQVRGGVKDKTPGTGLGLPLTKRFVEMHGGRLWVESEGEGKGSKFSFTLPIQGNERGWRP